MQIRRFLGKIVGVSLTIGSLSASAFVAADVYPGHDNVVGGWGQAPSYGEPVWDGSHHPAGPLFGGSQCCPTETCCHEPPACGVAYNPSAYFFCSSCPESNSFWDTLRFRGDFLWWRACEDDLALGTEQVFSRFPDGSTFQESRLKSPDFKYDPGFRIGLNTICPYDCWDVALNWTHFHTKANVHGESTFSAVTGNQFEEVLFVSEWERLADAVPDFSKGRWTLNLDLLDLEFGRKYYVASCFILRPHLGLRGARVDQSFRVHSEANRLEPYAEGGPAYFTSNTKAKNNFLAIGPRVGVDLELRLPCCITLFGQAAASLVFGRFERHAREYFNDFSTTGSTSDGFPANVQYEAHATLERCSRGITDLAIGLKWEHCCNWCNRQHPITIAFSWEHHAFYDFNNFIFDQNFSKTGTTFYGSRSKHGDLTTQGLTVSAEIGF